MQQLETTKGKSVVVPRLVNRYIVLYYEKRVGWYTFNGVFTTPESAAESFIDYQNIYKNENIKFYKIVEVEVEIPFVPQSSE